MSDQLNINLKLYRERLQDKYSKIGESSNKKSDYQLNSNRKSITKNAPTLDIISNRLKDYSTHQQSNKRIYQSPSNQIPNSPVRLNGMQQKIKSITTSPQVVMNNFNHPLGSPKTEVTQFQGFLSSPRATTERSEPNLLRRYNSNGDITSQIPFHDLVNMRNKLENCDINAAHITPTYLSEIVKLAHVLNNQLTKK